MELCERAISQMHLHIDNELSPEQASELDEHLKRCPSCAKEMRELVRLKSVLEERLDAQIAPPDDALVTARAVEAGAQNREKRSGAKFIKKVLIGAAAFVAVVLLSGYLFVHFYFQKTFSYQLAGIIVRCSDGIETAGADAQWRPLRVGERLRSATRIRTPLEAQSFMSVDGGRRLAGSRLRHGGDSDAG